MVKVTRIVDVEVAELVPLVTKIVDMTVLVLSQEPVQVLEEGKNSTVLVDAGDVFVGFTTDAGGNEFNLIDADDPTDEGVKDARELDEE